MLTFVNKGYKQGILLDSEYLPRTDYDYRHSNCTTQPIHPISPCYFFTYLAPVSKTDNLIKKTHFFLVKTIKGIVNTKSDQKQKI